jgi:hypothetical protein
METLVRETFREHEHLVEGGGARLLPAVRARTARRNATLSAAVALTVVAVLGAAVATVSLVPAARPGPAPSASASHGHVPAGWRLESSVGVQIAVPGDWTINDYGCGMTDRPTVVRGGDSRPMCYTPEPPTKQIADIQLRVLTPNGYTIGALPLHSGLPERSVSIGGVPATRAEGRLEDGRYGGWIWVPSRTVAVVVTTLDAGTVRQILDSTDLVDVDHAGCATRRPAPTPPTGATRATFVTPNPTEISICHYGPSPLTETRLPDGIPQLDASARITGDAALALAAVLNAAPAGPNPDAPAGRCQEDRAVLADAVLHLRIGDQSVGTVWITYSTCTQRGLYNGASRAHITHGLLRMIQSHVHAGYSLRADIPQ